jgi:hypothetical protein
VRKIWLLEDWCYSIFVPREICCYIFAIGISREIRKEFPAFMLVLKENKGMLPDYVTLDASMSS